MNGGEEGAAKPSSWRRDPGSKAELRRPRLLAPRADGAGGGGGDGDGGGGAFEYAGVGWRLGPRVGNSGHLIH